MTRLAAAITALVLALTACGPQEDDPFWDCHKHGNGVCGPLK